MPTSATQVITQTESILGKRKNRSSNTYLFCVPSTPGPHDFEPLPQPGSSSLRLARTSKSSLVLINGALLENSDRRYRCTFEGCDKAYSKPSRLVEHERSHTGQRPFMCETCQKTFLRDSHLHAHRRSHLPESSRPFSCPIEDCQKRFWTSQHLTAHEKIHSGARLFQCSATDCTEAFSKHHQLRTHMCTAHAPPGTKPYQCSHGGCTRSFTTNQKLRAHAKVHDSKRYTCCHSNCVPSPDGEPQYFVTWTALQHHLRTAHPPICDHPACAGRAFATQKGLRAHQKLHEQRDAEASLEAADSDVEDESKRRQKRRRGGEYGRDWKCSVEGCQKEFKSKKALALHVNVTHLGRRDFVCTYDSCKRAFGYKHLLQRHLAKTHHVPGTVTDTSDESAIPDRASEADQIQPIGEIDAITGLGYALHALQRLQTASSLRCPYPHLSSTSIELDFAANADDTAENSEPCRSVRAQPTQACDYVFSRAYDIWRHLKSEHSIATSRQSVDAWVTKAKNSLQGELHH